MMQPEAITAVRNGVKGIHVTAKTKSGPMEAVRYERDDVFGVDWIKCDHFDGTPAGWWSAHELTALERTYEPEE